jgi:hypothetical protein
MITLRLSGGFSPMGIMSMRMDNLRFAAAQRAARWRESGA